MKKRIFALALALCMMLSVMPTSFANGVLTLGDDTDSNGVLTLDNGTSGRSTTTSGSVQPRQDGVLYNTSGNGSEGEEDVELQTTYSTGTGKSGEALQTSGTTAYATAEDNDLMEIEPVDHDSTKLKIDKKATRVNGSSDSDPVYQIDLTAQALSNIQVQTKVSAMDIILVLDRSGNMIDDSGYNNMKDLIKAINGDPDDATNKGFLETIKANAEDSRVAVVTYEGKGKAAVISGNGQPNNGAFVKLSDTTNYNALRGEIGNLTTVVNSDAYSNEGFKNAAQIFQSVPSTNENYDNPRIVVFFTAGIPGAYGQGWEHHTGSGRSAVYPAYNIAQESIHWSRILKEGKGNRVNLDLSQEFWTWEGWTSAWDKGDSRTPQSVFYVAGEYDYRIGCGATVYCIGLNLPECGQNNHDEDDCSGTRVNEYLYRISNHRPDGSHVGSRSTTKYNPWEAETNYDWGSTYKDYYTRNISKTFGTKYPEKAAVSYYQVGSVSGISDMFQQIDVNVEQNQPITDATMRDYLAPGFVPCDANGNVLAVGDTIDGGTVKKDGDIYYIEWTKVTLTPSETETEAFTPTIYAKPAGSLGGNDIRTNVYGASGLYSGDTLFASFPETTANVPVKGITPELNGADIYLTQSATLNNLLKAYDSRIDGLCNSGVAITYTIYEGTTEIGSVTIPKGGTAKAAEWKPAEGQTLTPKLTDDKTYTIKCTVNGGTGNTSETTSRAASVRVFKPVFEYQDSTIYLSRLPDYKEDNLLAIEWMNGTSKANATSMGDAPELTYSYESSDSTFSQCADINVVVSKIGSTNATDELLEHVTFVNGTSHSGDEEADEFTVHVVKPVFETSNDTIYLSNKINLNDLMQVKEDWVCDSECNDKQSLKNAYVPNTITIDHSFSVNNVTVADELAPEDCATYTVTTTVNGLPVQSEAQVKVHVVKPEITNDDTAIYLGNTVDLNDQMTEEGTTWICDEDCQAPTSLDILNDNDERIAPALSHSFNVGVDGSYKPDTCTEVTVTSTVTSDESKDVTPEDNTFTVHVHVPQFTVTAQDLWADFNDTVYLYNNTDSDAIVSHVNTWVDREGHNNELEVSGAKEVVITDILFSEDDSYTMGETDVDVDVIKVQSTVNDVAYTAVKADSTENYDKQLTVVKAVAEEDHDFTIHINKFKAVITNNGEQNAIYTLSNGTKVAVPAKGSVTVAGLICGKEYTISEDTDNAWTWRYKDAATANYGDAKENISCTVGVQSEATDSSVDVSMNYGEPSNAKWLAGEDCVVNKLNANGKAVVALPAKKEEEVNA